MANFNTHLNGAFVVSGVLGLVAYKLTWLDTPSFLLCVLLGTIGGLLPDIDSDNSRPIRIGFDVGSFFVAFALVIYYRETLNLLWLLLVWLLGFLIMRYLVFNLFTKLTVHRGVIHSVPYMAMLALSLVCISFYYFHFSVLQSWFYGIFLFIGAMVHLLLDEMYSVNLLGLKVKKSFGTALKFYQDKDRYWYILIYAILAMLLFIVPPFMPFWEQVSDITVWQSIKNDLH